MWRRLTRTVAAIVRWLFPTRRTAFRSSKFGRENEGETGTTDILGSPAQPATPAETRGPTPKRPQPTLVGIEFEPTADSRVSRLRRAAAVQMFELAGLSIVPGQFWQFLEQTPAPADAVIQFLAALGIDSNKVRAGDLHEIEAANEVLDLLVEIDGAFTRLSDVARADVQTAIYCGEYDRVRDAAHVVRTYASILELDDRYAADQRFPAFTDFLRDVANELDRPLSARPSDAADAERIRLKMSKLLRMLGDERAEHERLIILMWTDFPEWKVSALQSDITLTLSRFEATLESIVRSPNSLDEVAELIANLSSLNSTLRALFAALASGGDRTKSGGGTRGKSSNGGPSAGRYTAGATALDRALSYFGLDLSRLPNRAEFKRIKRAIWMKTHPDTGGSSHAFRECMEYSRLVEDHLATA